MSKEKIILVLIIFLICITTFAVSWQFHRNTVTLNEQGVLGTWKSTYSVYSGNFCYFHLPVLTNTRTQMSCTEKLQINNDNHFTQIVICADGELSLTYSGTWTIQEINHRHALQLSGMKYFFPDVNLEELAPNFPKVNWPYRTRKRFF